MVRELIKNEDIQAQFFHKFNGFKLLLLPLSYVLVLGGKKEGKEHSRSLGSSCVETPPVFTEGWGIHWLDSNSESVSP